ncbi:MAG TPA: hypothetical protein VIV40_32165 [Kofleriaceae bacterium]
MNRSAFAIVAVLAGCAGEDSGPAGTNPPTLWLAMNTADTQMMLVGEEPHAY